MNNLPYLGWFLVCLFCFAFQMFLFFIYLEPGFHCVLNNVSKLAIFLSLASNYDRSYFQIELLPEVLGLGFPYENVKVTDINPKTKQMILKTALSHLQVRCLEHNVERKKCYHSLG